MAAVSSIVYQQRSRSTNLDEILENRQIVLSLLLVSVKRVKIYQIKPTSGVTGLTEKRNILCITVSSLLKFEFFFDSLWCGGLVDY